MHSGDLFIYFFNIFCLNPAPIHMPPILQAYVKDSIWIPMYEVDKSLDPGTLFKKLSNFTMGTCFSILECKGSMDGALQGSNTGMVRFCQIWVSVK